MRTRDSQTARVILLVVLRPSSNLLGSSRPTHRANLRAERLRALWLIPRAIKAAVSAVVSAAWDLVLLCALPLAYLASSYLVLDLPARWFAHRGAYGGLGALLFLASLGIAYAGIARAVQDAPPIAPVRPKFAKAMLGLSWAAALLCTIGDLAG
jgi:hypothetical protein